MLKEIVVDGVVVGSVDVPDGWELVAFRSHVQGEHVINAFDGTVIRTMADGAKLERRWIVRKAFVFPEWVKPGAYYAKDQDGSESLHSLKPYLCRDGWDPRDEAEVCRINREIMDFPVFCGDWKDSLRQKPLEAK